MAQMNPNLILAASQQPDVMNALTSGMRGAAVQNEVMDSNALRSFMRDNGAAVMAGDGNALSRLSQLGPRGLEMASAAQDRQRQYQMQQERLQMARAAAGRAAASHAAKVGEAQARKEAEELNRDLRKAGAYLAQGDLGAFNMMMMENGAEPIASLDDAAGVLMQFEGVRDGLLAYREADALLNPQPEPGYSMLAPDEAAGLGLPEGTYQRGPDGKIMAVGGGGQTINVNSGGQPEIGTIPQGYEVFTNPETGRREMRAIPGGPNDTTANEEAKATQTSRAAGVVLEDIGRVTDKIEKSPWFSPSTGFAGSLLSQVPGTNAYDVSSLLQTIGGNIGFDRLQQMRDASPTGGALGAINQQEMGLLMSVMGNLNQSQTEEQLLFNLDRLNEIYSGILRKAAAYPNAAEYGFGGAGQRGGDDGIPTFNSNTGRWE